MKTSDEALLDQIERDVLDDGVTTSAILRKCIILGGRAGSTELRDWAKRELTGYSNTDDVPAYRAVDAPLVMTVSNGFQTFKQELGPEQVPEPARDWGFVGPLHLRQSLDTLEKTVAAADGPFLRIVSPGGPRVVELLTQRTKKSNPGMTILSVHWDLAVPSMEGVIGRIRTVLAEFVAELSAESRAAGPEEPLTKAQVDNAFHLAVTGSTDSNINVSITNNIASGGSTSTSTVAPPTAEPQGFWARWRKRGIVIGIATVVAAVAGVGAWFWPL